MADPRHAPPTHGSCPSTKPVCADTNVTDIGANPAGTGPPVADAVVPVVGLTVAGGAVEAGWLLGPWVLGVDAVEETGAGDATLAEVAAGELTAALLWCALEQPVMASNATTAMPATPRVDDRLENRADGEVRGVMLLRRHSSPKGCISLGTDRPARQVWFGQFAHGFGSGARLAQSVSDSATDLA